MSVYLPLEAHTAWLVGVVLLGTLVLASAISRRAGVGVAGAPAPDAKGRWAAWLLVAVSVVGVERLCRDEPAGFRMVALILALFLSLKAVVSVEAQAAGQPRLSALRWLAFATLWPGMRPALFAAAGGPSRPGAGLLITKGIKRLTLGMALIFLARLLWRDSAVWLPEKVARVAATICVLPGLGLVLHFGIFNVLAGAWRWGGVDARPLFRAPLLASSLTDFWGRRWNLAFSEMAALGIYRPLATHVGKTGALLGVFLCSGVFHELAISVPVNAGYGLPFLYFTLHGLLMVVERKLAAAGRPVDQWGWLGRVWTAAWLVLPLPILFHPPFLHGVVWPLLGVGDCARASIPV
jgi:alginate O-acetyltransferase complex protein AlgI